MKTTILLTLYNGEKYLPELAGSLRRQTYADFSVLYQDDGSKDGTAEIMRALEEEDPRFVKGKENGRHLGAMRNFFSLMRQDDGDRTALCDQDDVWMPERISSCMEAMDHAEREFGKDTPILIHSDACLISADGDPIADSFLRSQGWDPKAVSLRELLVQNNATGCTMLLNRALRELVTANARTENMFMHDWFIAQTAAAFGKVILLDRPLVAYRQHGGNEIGASKDPLLKRGMKAIRTGEKARKRIKLTYRQAENLKLSYGRLLPTEASEIVDRYLSTEKMNKIKRVITVQKEGYRMQNRITRAGQILFG